MFFEIKHAFGAFFSLAMHAVSFILVFILLFVLLVIVFITMVPTTVENAAVALEG